MFYISFLGLEEKSFFFGFFFNQGFISNHHLTAYAYCPEFVFWNFSLQQSSIYNQIVVYVLALF